MWPRNILDIIRVGGCGGWAHQEYENPTPAWLPEGGLDLTGEIEMEMEMEMETERRGQNPYTIAPAKERERENKQERESEREG